MAVTYSVQAEVIDLRSDTPGPGDGFFVDTNVWYWLTYTRCRMAYRGPQPYQVNEYPAYIKKARGAKANLFTCGLCFSELANLIERNELDIFRMSKGQIEIKEFRHNEQTERNNVVTEIQDAWAMAKSFAGFNYTPVATPGTNSPIYFRTTSTLSTLVGGTPLTLGAFVYETDYKVASTLRSTGSYLLIKGGIWTNWTLIWSASDVSETPIYAGLWQNSAGVDSGSYTSSFLRIPQALWLPTPLLSTSGAMTWPTTNGLGHAEGVAGGLGAGGSGLTMLDMGTWAAGGTYVTNTPVAGVDKVSNGDFSAADNWQLTSADWSIGGGVATKVLSIGGQSIYQYVFSPTVAGQWYGVELDIAPTSGGAFDIYCGGAYFGSKGVIGSPATYYLTNRALNTETISILGAANRAGTIDNVSDKPLPISSLITNVQLATTDVLAEAVIHAYTLSSQCGIVQSDRPFAFAANANAAAGQNVIVLKGLTKAVPDTDSITIKHPIAGGTIYTIASVGSLSGGIQTLTLDTNLVEAVSADDDVGVDWASWNGVLCYFDGAGNLKLDQIKAGVYTNRISDAETFEADKRLILRKIGSEYRVFHKEALVATTSLVEAECMVGKYWGLFSTLAANQVTSFVVHDTGNVTNTHSILDKWSQDSSSLNLPKEYCPDTYWHAEVACG